MDRHPDVVVSGARLLRVGFLSETGTVRERNEDAWAVHLRDPGGRGTEPFDALLAVADGMGGHDAGDLASRFTIEVIERASIEDADLAEAPEAWMRSVFGAINDRLRVLSRLKALGRSMGTTLTLALVSGDALRIGHVGDTRCYRWRGDRLERLTEDDTWVAEQRRAGLLSESEEATHESRNVLTRSLGTEKGRLEAGYAEHGLEVGDRLLVCSDGLHGVVGDAAIADELARADEPQRAVRALVDRAHAAGSPDNVTAVALFVDRGREGRATEPAAALRLTGGAAAVRRRWTARALVVAGIVLVVLGLAAAGWLALHRDAGVAAPPSGPAAGTEPVSDPAAGSSAAERQPEPEPEPERGGPVP